MNADEHRLELDRITKKIIGCVYRVSNLLVEHCVIVELKATKAFEEVHSAQCLNYLRAAGLKVCLLINFGKPRAEIRRIVSDF